MSNDEHDEPLSHESQERLNDAIDGFQRLAQMALIKLADTADGLGVSGVGNLMVQEAGRLLGTVIHEVSENAEDPAQVTALALEEAIGEAQEVLKQLRWSDLNAHDLKHDLADEISSVDSISDIKR